MKHQVLITTRHDREFMCKLMLVVLTAVRGIVILRYGPRDWWEVQLPHLAQIMKHLIDDDGQVDIQTLEIGR